MVGRPAPVHAVTSRILNANMSGQKKQHKKEAKKVVKVIERVKVERKPRAKVGKPQVSRMAVVQAASDAATKLCAEQMLNADYAVQNDALSDAPMSDGSAVHLWTSTTEVTLSSVNRTDNAAAYIFAHAGPSPQAHLQYGTAFDNTGAATAGGTINVEGYSSLATIYDDIRCCAMMMVVKDFGLEEKLNGVARVLNFNPAATLISDAVANANPGFEYPPSKTHYSRTPWFPARPEVDHAWMSPTATRSSESTILCYRQNAGPIATSQTMVRVTVYAVWAGRLNPDTDHVAVPKVYAIDPKKVEMMLQSMLLPPSGLYTQTRIMAKDDGAIKGLAQDLRSGWSGAKTLFGKDSSLGDRVTGALDLFSAVGSVGSTIMGWFSMEDQVLARLQGLTQEQLGYIVALVETSRRAGPALTPENITALFERARYRRHMNRPVYARGSPAQVLVSGMRLPPHRALACTPIATSGGPEDPWLERYPYTASSGDSGPLPPPIPYARRARGEEEWSVVHR